MPFDLAIFDYDGVLVDSLDQVLKASEEVCRALGHHRTLDKETIATLQPMTYTQLARSIGMPPDRVEAFSEHIFKKLQQADEAMPFFPGIGTLLSQRSPQNTAIVSGNSREVISAKLTAHALNGHVYCILGAYQTGDKADKIYRACAELGAEPGRTCMIGDSVSDIQYAKKAGVQSVAVTWGWQARNTLANEQPDYIVERVSELSALLR